MPSSGQRFEVKEWSHIINPDVVDQAGEESLLLFSFFPLFNHICKRFSINFQESVFYIELSVKFFKLVQPMIVYQVFDEESGGRISHRPSIFSRSTEKVY